MELHKKTVTQFIDDYSNEFSDKIFLIDADKDLIVNYKKLKEDISRLKVLFEKYSLSYGDKVGFMLDNSYESTLFFLGVIYYGLTIVPINIVSGFKSVEFVVKHSDCKIIFSSKKYLEEFANEIKDIEHIYTYENIDDLPQCSDDNSQPLNDNINEDTEALIIYTSGTTGAT